MELHPLCTYFPRMSDDEFNSLKDSLQHNGQTHPIYTLDGMILDGGNRYRALCELGIDPVMVEYTGTNPTQFILSSNLHRRHLTQGQSAAIVSASQSWINTQSAAHLQTDGQLDTAASRAKQSGAGQRTQQLADKLVKEAPAELIKEVIDGKKSLNKAIKEISPPKPVATKTSVSLAAEDFANSLDDVDLMGNSIDEQHAVLNTLETDNTVMSKRLESCDKISTPLEDVKRLTALNKVLNARITELTKEKDEAVKMSLYWKDRFLALETLYNKEIKQ